MDAVVLGYQEGHLREEDRLWEPEVVCASGRTVGQEQGCVGFQEPGLGTGESDGEEVKERGELSCCFEEGR